MWIGKKILGWINLDHVGVCLMVFFLGWLLAFASLNLSMFNPLKRAFKDFSMTDVYYEILHDDGNKELCPDITLVDMTDLYDRKDIARCISDINACHPKVLAVDLIFERPGYDEMADVELANAVNESANVILSCKLTGYDETHKVFRNQLTSYFNTGDKRWAYTNMVSGLGINCIRKYTVYERCEDDTIYSMPYRVACRYLGLQPKPESPKERTIIYANTDFPVVPCDSVKQNVALLKNRIVFLGAMREEADMHISPLGKTPGMKILAYSTLSAIHHRHIIQSSTPFCVFLTFIICYMSAFFGYKIGIWRPNSKLYWLKFYYFIVMALLVWAGFILFVRWGYNLSLLLPLLGLALVETARLHYKWIIMMLARHTHWNFIKHSIYYEN